MSRWWRAEDTSIDHPKLLKLSDAMFRAWYTLNCVASANDGVLPSTEDVAVRLRMKPAKVAEWITRLVAAGLYDNDDGVFRPHNWAKRQYKTDASDPTNAERQKRYRERHRNGDKYVTSNGSNGVTVKRPEAETETNQSRADARSLDEIKLKQRKALEAFVVAVCADEYRQPPDMSIIGTWLLDGISPATISTVIPPILKRKADMLSLVYCDGAVREAHSKDSAPVLQVVSKKVWVDEGTMEWGCHQQEARRKTGRGIPAIDQKDERGAPTGRRGFYFNAPVPEGFDEQTGERLSSEPIGDVA